MGSQCGSEHPEQPSVVAHTTQVMELWQEDCKLQGRLYHKNTTQK